MKSSLLFLLWLLGEFLCVHAVPSGMAVGYDSVNSVAKMLNTEADGDALTVPAHMVSTLYSLSSGTFDHTITDPDVAHETSAGGSCQLWGTKSGGSWPSSFEIWWSHSGADSTWVDSGTTVVLGDATFPTFYVHAPYVGIIPTDTQASVTASVYIACKPSEAAAATSGVYTDDGDWTATSSSHNLIGGIYQSTPGTITDGDTGPIRLDANGAVHINDGGNSITVDDGGTTLSIDDGGGALTVDNAGTFAVQVDGDALTSLQLLDDVIVTDSATGWVAGTNKLALIGGVYEASPTAISSGDTGTLHIDANGAVHINDGGNSITVDDGGTTLSIDDGGGALTVDNGGTFAVQVDGDALTSLQLLDDVIVTDSATGWVAGTNKLALIGGVYEASPTAISSGDTGTLHIDANGAVHINDGGNSITVDDGGTTLSIDDGGGALTVDNAGTFAVQVDGDALTALQLLDDVIVTDSNTGWTAGTNKLALVGGVYEATPTALSDGDTGTLHLDANGALEVTESEKSMSTNVIVSASEDETTTNQAITTDTLYLSQITITNPSTTAFAYVKIYDDTAANGGTADNGVILEASELPVIVIAVPANTAHSVSYPRPIYFSNGIITRVTLNPGNTDNTAPETNCVITFTYYSA